jgi:hypothetical protein
MPEMFYAGHSFDWMKRFLNAIPKGSRLVKSTAVCIAEVIHHQFIYKKQPILILNHAILERFGVGRQHIKPYLLHFQEVGLINVSFKRGVSPKIELLAVPPKYLIINNEAIKNLTSTVQVSQRGLVPVATNTSNLSQQGPVTKRVLKQGDQESKGTEEAKELRRRGKEGAKKGNRGSKGTEDTGAGME